MIGAVESKSLILFYQVNFYRFSISWPRIFPDGTASSYNQKGMDYYISLVDELVTNGKSLLTNAQTEAPASPHKYEAPPPTDILLLIDMEIIPFFIIGI